MDVKHFIKELQKWDSKLTVGFEVITERDAFLWQIEKSCLKFSAYPDKPALIVGRFRLKNPLSEREQLKKKLWCIDDYDFTDEHILKDFTERYDVTLEGNELENLSDKDVKEFMIDIVEQDLKKLIVLYESLKRLGAE